MGQGHRQDTLEQAVLHALQHRLMDQALVEVFCKEYTAELNRLRMEHNASLRGYRTELEKLAGRQKRIVKAVMDGYSTDAMKDESNAIVRREQELKALLSEQKEAPMLLHPAMGLRYHAEVKNLIAA